MGAASSKELTNTLDTRYVKTADRSKVIDDAQTRFDGRYVTSTNLPNQTIFCGPDGVNCATPAATQNVRLGGKTNVTGELAAASFVTGGNITGANITATGVVSGPTFTATGDVNANNVFVKQAVRGATFTATGDVTGNNVIGTASVSGGNFAATGNVTAQNVTARAAVTGPTFTATGNVTGANLIATENVNAKNIVASGTVTAPNLYNRVDAEKMVDGKLAGAVASGTVAQLSNLDVTMKSVAVPRGGTVRLSGTSDPVHTLGHSAAFNITDQDGPFLGGWHAPPAGHFSGSLGVQGGEPAGQPLRIKHALRWNANNVQVPGDVRLRVGQWTLREDGTHLILQRDGSGEVRDQAFFRFAPDGNFLVKRHDMDWVGDRLNDLVRRVGDIEKNAVFKNRNVQLNVAGHPVSKQNDNYLRANDTDEINQGWKTDPNRGWGTWVIRDA
jgi:cytoskeletal protein CcmA (bactofilin family)